MDILEQNPHLANRHCCGNYMMPNDKVEIKFNNLKYGYLGKIRA